MVRSISKIINQFKRYSCRRYILKHLKEFDSSQNKIKLLKLELEKRNKRRHNF